MSKNFFGRVETLIIIKKNKIFVGSMSTKNFENSFEPVSTPTIKIFDFLWRVETLAKVKN